MKTKVLRTAGLVLVAGLALSLTACDEVYDDHYPTYGGGYYYHYYPDLQVYYDTRSGMYFYYTPSGWIRTQYLPRHYHIHRHQYHPLRLQHQQPYRYHQNWQQYKHSQPRRNSSPQRYSPKHRTYGY